MSIVLQKGHFIQLKECFYVVGSKFVPPEEKLRISGRSVEEQIRTFVMDVLEPAGFEVQKFTKLPYLCEGDLYDDYFLLYDYVFVLKSRILSD